MHALFSKVAACLIIVGVLAAITPRARAETQTENIVAEMRTYLYLQVAPDAVQSFLPGGEETPAYLSPGGEIFVISPFLISLLGSWACYYEAERTIVLSRSNDFEVFPWHNVWEYVGFQARQMRR